MNIDDSNGSLQRKSTGNTLGQWIGFNVAIAGLYLAFFYGCLAIGWPWSLGFGFSIAGVLIVLITRYRRLFLNRYELLFYLAIPLDVGLESLIPTHFGYSFYWCAASFWSVFVLYRGYVRIFGRQTTTVANQSHDAATVASVPED